MQAAAAERHPETKDILSHWPLALPVLLVVACLSIQQIDRYPPTVDEFG